MAGSQDASFVHFCVLAGEAEITQLLHLDEHTQMDEQRNGIGMEYVAFYIGSGVK